MIIKVPPQIQVGGHTYTIQFNKELGDSNEYGYCNHRKLLIEINPIRPESQKVEALIHETLHVINHVYNNNRSEEEEIGALSEGLNQVVAQLGITLDWTAIGEQL